MGFIGLGNMGSRMAANLRQGGQQLVVHDSSIAAVEQLCRDGAESASSPRDMASTEGSMRVNCPPSAQSQSNQSDCLCTGVDVIITMLPSAQHVQEVYLGSEGILKAQGDKRTDL